LASVFRFSQIDPQIMMVNKLFLSTNYAISFVNELHELNELLLIYWLKLILFVVISEISVMFWGNELARIIIRTRITLIFTNYLCQRIKRIVINLFM